MAELDQHVAENRRHWDEIAHDWVAGGERQWARPDPAWGIWQLPESELQLLPGDLHGMRAIELGCGTGYVSAWLSRRGASVYAIDNSERQLATARRLAVEHGLDGIEWVHGNAEAVPVPDGSFDFAVSEYGAAIWCDPRAWIPEAHRLLRPAGVLVFIGNHPLLSVCSPVDGSLPVTRYLERSYFDLGRLDWTDAVHEPGGMAFNLPISSWLELFDEVGFDVVRFLEVRAPESAPADQFGVPAEWARHFPSEQVWCLRRR